MGEHACRALLIIADPHSSESVARAWISAHCHLADKGDRQVCSEQITFQLCGETVDALPNIVFSHLDSDLPLYFWWRGEFREPLDEKLWSWIDRLIYDSAIWSKPAAQFALARKIGDLTADRTVLCDLNWTRLYGTRYALAQLFDHACALPRLKTIEHVSITCAKRTTGLLLLGWLAAQLGWQYQNLLGKQTFLTPSGSHVEFQIEEKAGADISSCTFTCADATFALTRKKNADYFEAHITGTEVKETSLMIAGGKCGLADILLVELSRGGRHPLYAKALAEIELLLE